MQAEIASNEAPAIEVGGAIQAKTWQLDRGMWYQVTKLNPKTIEVYAHREFNSRPLIERTDIEHIASKLRVDAGEVQCAKLTIAKPSKGSKSPRVQNKTKAGEVPEVLGAYVDDNDQSVANWKLIIRLNGRTVTGFYSKDQTYQEIGEGGKYTPTTRRYFYTPKDLVNWIKALYTPAQVKAQAPQLLAEYERYKVSKKKHAERAKLAEAAAIERSKALAPTP